MQNKSGAVAVSALAGMVVGAGVALLVAPLSGEETRQRLRDSGKSFKNDVTAKSSDVKDTLTGAAGDVKAAAEEATNSIKKASRTLAKTATK